MEFTGAFDNMPACVVAVKRNLDREDGFEEVYLNNALKNKKISMDNSEKSVLSKVFQNRYDELKKVISDIFSGIKKAEVISSYNEEFGGYFSAQFYIAGEPEYCICVFTEEMEGMENKSLKCAYDISRVANEAKNAFLRHIGQYMKTPVNYIIGITDMLWASKKYYHDNERYISKIRNASDTLLENLNKILDVSRIASGDTKFLYEKISFRALIDEIIGEIEEFAVIKGHQLIIDTTNIIHDNVYIDKMMLKQAIKNIVLNAVQYTDKNGIIKVTVVEGKQKFGDLSIYEIIVDDNGSGIEKQYIDNALKSIIFEHDNKQNEHGIGLGLWITKNIIRVLNGDLKVESEPENGTKCTISVPVSTEDNYCKDDNYLSENQALEFIRHKNKRDIKRVLIVQNLITSRNMLRQKLICLGFDVECASTGKEALLMYNEKGEGYYSAIITNAQLPEMSGYDLALEIRRKEKGIYLPIIAMSKNHYLEDSVFSEEMGITSHISKDADISVLKAALEKLNI